MRGDAYFRTRDGERGQTIILVAISIISLLAMAALAIDVVTLYVARAELQRAADAAALVAAKAVVDSGFTSLNPSDANFANARSLASVMATREAQAILPQNPVAGSPPAPVTPTIDYSTHQGNPIITVELQQTNLPTFFARIWGTRSATVTATAVAEAYNPANNATYAPIALTNVKPWLVANADPQESGTPFIDRATGNISTPVGRSVIGETFDLTSDCTNSGSSCTILTNPPQAITASNQVQYVPAVTSGTATVCPSSCPGATSFELSIQCADPTSYAYLNCGGTVQTSWDNGVNPNHSHLSAEATECLINASSAGPGQGQDVLDASQWPGHPMKITLQSYPAQPITTSKSIVTIPIIDTPTGVPIPATGGAVTIVGYLQAFINGVEPGFNVPFTTDDINITVLNVVGCANGNASATPAVVGSTGTSTIPIRLITPP